jgi:SAM-dependent methyltransferase
MNNNPSKAQKWNDRYAGSSYFYGTEPNDYLVHSTTHLPLGTALCLADGEGRNAVWLARQGWVTSSVDFSVHGVDKARQLADKYGVSLDAQVDDLETYEIAPNTFDLIVSIFAHTSLDIRKRTHRQVVDALKPGGVFILEAYTPAQIPNNTGGPKDPSSMPTAEQLRDELNGLTFEHIQELDREVMEGPGHTGMASVVQVIARKPD